jgi:hypothetical protein
VEKAATTAFSLWRSRRRRRFFDNRVHVNRARHTIFDDRQRHGFLHGRRWVGRAVRWAEYERRIDAHAFVIGGR